MSDLELQLSTLPESPGVYQYFNTKDEIIYVGKAKNLKKRVNSYFGKIHEYQKVNVLVKNIAYLKYIVVASETDALLLENNLIKLYQPRYNVMLKDGKTYPSICITKEEFPRVFKTRKIIKAAGEYYGPYSSSYTINSLLEIIHNIFAIRTCNLPLTAEKIAKNRFKVCLKYHIHKCDGICQSLITAEQYALQIENIRQIIRGNAAEIEKFLQTQMKSMAEELRFEEAQKIKEKYDLIVNFRVKSVITNTILDNTDVFAYDEEENSAFVNILRIHRGSIVQGYTVEYRKQLNELREDILAMAVVELRDRLGSDSREIILPFAINFPMETLKLTVDPRSGDRKKLLELAAQNVREYKLDRLKQAEKLNPDQRGMRILKDIQEKLGLAHPPIVIEAFDNSNISGTNAVAACVVFRKAKPSKSDYRKYNIKTVDGPDDYASMREVVYRRYSRMIAEEQPLPDLIITDGGKGQMEVVRQVVENQLGKNIPIAGLAKNEHHRTNELLFGFPPKEIQLKPNDTLFKFLASVQDEVHRFAITFHKQKRSKSQIESELDTINGIGEKTKTDLLKHFKSVARIKKAELAELQSLIGTRRAAALYAHFNPKMAIE
ncbi:MAG: excinuclease ABC subunit UvrC [Paludibacter sp.]|jgi:excinuclease ABC subunit C|nr:excinuclease ABC subunit UvrC [Paludibacter sp.]